MHLHTRISPDLHVRTGGTEFDQVFRRLVDVPVWWDLNAAIGEHALGDVSVLLNGVPDHIQTAGHTQHDECNNANTPATTGAGTKQLDSQMCRVDVAQRII